MIASMVNKEDHVTLPYKHKLTHATDNILVVANIIEQTGGSKGEDSKVLRVVENPGTSSDPLVHFYFNDTNYINVPLRNFHNIHIRLISASSHYDLTMPNYCNFSRFDRRIEDHNTRINLCPRPKKLQNFEKNAAGSAPGLLFSRLT